MGKHECSRFEYNDDSASGEDNYQSLSYHLLSQRTSLLHRISVVPRLLPNLFRHVFDGMKDSCKSHALGAKNNDLQLT